ncbi:UBP18 [Symbiodinium natans]|uniref:UBP18 protein n=1 Tax=Symbiodinium natans TaxID=878477 RepID=A0A812LIK2_9DINO|nr:UBP18 [Symbiodinium natans]
MATTAATAQDDVDTSQDIAETRKLLELAAQRCSELRSAVESAKAQHGYSPENGSEVRWSTPCVPTQYISPGGPNLRAVRFSSAPLAAPLTALSPSPVQVIPGTEKYFWPGIAPAAQPVSCLHRPPVSLQPHVAQAFSTSPTTAHRQVHMSATPTSFSALLPGAHVFRSTTTVGQRSVQRVDAVGVRPAAKQAAEAAGQETSTSEQIQSAPTGTVRPTLDLMLSGTRCAKCRVYLYQAPFSPAVRYVDGEELFAVPAGWAVLRTRAGLLLWLELSDDTRLLEALKAAEKPQAPEGRQGATASRSSSKDRVPRGRKSMSPSASRRLLPLAFTVSLVELHSEGASHQLAVRSRGCCAIDSLVSVPCEDVMVLQPQGGGGRGIRASLSMLSEGIAKTSVDAAFKAWLSSWSSQM